MKDKSPPPLPPKLKAIHQRFQRWRNSRKKRRERIPERLWRAAVKLCTEYSINTVAMALRVNHTDLKRRADTASGGQFREVFEPTFLEVDLPQSTPRGECVLELEDRRGAKMTIRLKDSSALDVVGLSKAFWSRRR